MDGAASDAATGAAPRSTLQSRLLILTCGTLLPTMVFGIVVVALLGQREQAVFERGARERTRALLTAVDGQLEGHGASLRLLASSLTLAAHDLAAFHDEMMRTLPTQPHWIRIALALPAGRRVLDTTEPPDIALPPVVDRSSFDEAVRTGRPVIGSLFDERGTYQFAVRMPVTKDGDVTYVLSAIVDPAAILTLLTPQRLPADWVGVVLDANDRIVARTLDQQGRFGQLASDSLRAALARAPTGWFRGATLEHADVYTPYTRSTVSGWTVALGIPASVVQAGARRAMLVLALGVVAALATAVLLAIWLSRLISSPISSLAAAARALGRGAPIEPIEGGNVREVRDVARALTEAASAVQERENALRAADRAKDEYLAMLAHELRNPLGALASAAQVLQVTGTTDGDAKRAADVIDRQVSHMARMIDDLLDVGRVTTGKISLSRRPVDLAEITESVLRALRSSERLRRHDIELDASPAWIAADDTRVAQIVSNLVENAVKYTPPGGRIAIRVFRRGDAAVLEVADTGVGLSADLEPHVFDLFVQGDRSLDRRPGGLGVGLTLVKHLTELHGGRVEAASDGPGRGAQFTVSFPATVAPIVRAADAQGVPGPRRASTILLIEDNDDVREALQAALSLRGYRVVEASDGIAGVAAAATARAEVAIVDVGLPGMDGYEVVRRLRALPGGADILVIALTGYGQDESRRRAFEAGFDEYFTKPVSSDALASVIDAHLGSQSAS